MYKRQDQAKAFFLDSPVADSVESIALPREFQAQVRHAVSQVMAAYFRDKPVYVLREDGSAQEIAARWLLRGIRIETVSYTHLDVYKRQRSPLPAIRGMVSLWTKSLICGEAMG